MGERMDRATRKKTEDLALQLHAALEGLAKLHGDPRHIGAGFRREGNRQTVFVYLTNPRDGQERPGEIWLPQEVPFSVALLTHTIPMAAVSEDEAAPRFSRAPTLIAAAALAAVGE